ncbi:MAG: hypothetical protein ACREHF_01115 [Rhizomicrobium sp.]
MRMLITAALLGAALVPVQAMAASPFDGTWKEDVTSAKMTQEPDSMVLKDGMYTCKSCVPSYTVKADGTDQPVSGDPYYDTVSVNASDQHNVVVTEKKGGKTMETVTFKVAPDDKSIDVDFSGVGTNGASYNGTGGLKRVAKGPKGSEPISGSWMRTGLTNVSDNIVTVTYKVSGDTLTMTDPTGDSFTATMNGTKAPYKGNPGVTDVRVRKLGANSIMETDLRDGKDVETIRSTVEKDGTTMKVVDSDKLHHRTTTYKATKQ